LVPHHRHVLTKRPKNGNGARRSAAMWIAAQSLLALRRRCSYSYDMSGAGSFAEAGTTRSFLSEAI
jgi:hypothetical protein